jgi:hypothetical protein
MTEDERPSEPTTGEPAVDATRPPESGAAPKDPVEPVEADKTDMSAVGDDGQVFGG